MKFSLLAVAIFLSMFVSAQDCSKEALRKKPGRWTPGLQGSIRNVNAADLAKEKATMAKVHKMVTASYKPVGCEISHNTVFGKHLPAASNWIADPYYYSMYVLRYLCDESSADKSKHYVDHSTPTVVNISANQIQWLDVLYAADMASDDFRGYLKLKTRPVRKDSVWFMGEEVAVNSDQQNKIKEYRWLITYSDTLPFSYVTRKEYLLIQKKRLEKGIKESPSQKSYLDKFMQNVNEYLKKPESELNQPAVCRWNDEERFEGFVEEGTAGSFTAVKPNLAYYRKKLSASSPQFITVVYKISHGDPVFEENMAAIQKAVDFKYLRSLLGK